MKVRKFVVAALALAAVAAAMTVGARANAPKPAMVSAGSRPSVRATPSSTTMREVRKS